MTKKIFVFALIAMLFMPEAYGARARKKSKSRTSYRTTRVQKARQAAAAEYDEIDSFDFLYTDAEVNFDDATVGNIMNDAFALIGTPYRFGSKGPYTFDCSGFTSYVFRQNGIMIGYDSRDQYRRNKPITREQAQPGDLVFFTSRRAHGNVGHVGIVVDVDPITQSFNFIHASTKDGVRVSNIRETYYATHFVGLRRVQ